MKRYFFLIVLQLDLSYIMDTVYGHTCYIPGYIPEYLCAI